MVVGVAFLKRSSCCRCPSRDEDGVKNFSKFGSFFRSTLGRLSGRFHQRQFSPVAPMPPVLVVLPKVSISGWLFNAINDCE